MTREEIRIRDRDEGRADWAKWGPYVSDRQWGTVREDYSSDGEPWTYLTHDQSRSRAYRWGEDGIAGFCDDQQLVCIGLSLWNTNDPILKERLFGLGATEGNHGEDVKELYYYLEATPTHSYMKMLYKYPHARFPYEDLLEKNRERNRDQREYELLDTGVFLGNNYFDVFVEYAKANEAEVLMQVTVFNRGQEDHVLHVIPQLWFRNTWDWGIHDYKPRLSVNRKDSIHIEHQALGNYYLSLENEAPILFCENETNYQKVFQTPNHSPYPKDGFHEYIIHGNNSTVNPAGFGTKAAVDYQLLVPGGGSQIIRLRLGTSADYTFDEFENIRKARQEDADEVCAFLQQKLPGEEERMIQRQALAGMIWNKQFYKYDIEQWMRGNPKEPPPPASRLSGRNREWTHLNNGDIISIPDKWEFPWYAAWDLAFHCIPLTLIDPAFAKGQLKLLTREWYMHPNGQFPAYEWKFSDVNPPVHAWATWRVYKIDKKLKGSGDIEFLESVYHKLLINFTWWVNRKDSNGQNIFQGGFLGLDNIGVFDRNTYLPSGAILEQADATGWMAMYSLNMMRIALELSLTNNVYQEMATKFLEHFLYIAGAMANMGISSTGLWDEEDQYYYDQVKLVSGETVKLKIRSMVGLIPLFAVEVLDHETLVASPEFTTRLRWFLEHRPELAKQVSRWEEYNKDEKHLLSLLRGSRMKKILNRMLDEKEFLSPFGIRSLSRIYLDNPYQFNYKDTSLTVKYAAGESTIGMFGGNSNWRGPVWMPPNFLIIESLQRFHHYYGEDFKVECPTHSGQYMSLNDVALFLSDRLANIFRKNEQGYRPVNGDSEVLATDPYFANYILFYEHFHGDDGRGIGASHQTGWTGLIAKLLHPKVHIK
ncbi:MAG: glucosidase [Chitinophagaceae bacterium]